MRDWINRLFHRPKYPTWDDVPPAEQLANDMSKVIPFPEPKETPKMPEVVPPKEKPATVFYRFGVTDNNRVSFQMGYSEITMNKEGCRQLINQLEVFMEQLKDED